MKSETFLSFVAVTFFLIDVSNGDMNVHLSINRHWEVVIASTLWIMLRNVHRQNSLEKHVKCVKC